MHHLTRISVVECFPTTQSPCLKQNTPDTNLNIKAFNTMKNTRTNLGGKVVLGVEAIVVLVSGNLVIAVVEFGLAVAIAIGIHPCIFT
jgi:hypothetical protein